jgi:hypothetical protein
VTPLLIECDPDAQVGNRLRIPLPHSRLI